MQYAIRILAVCCAAVLLLSSCGKPSSPPSAAKPQSAAETTEEQTTKPTFRYTKKTLPEGWKTLDKFGTSTYLEAVWGEGEKAPMLTVSVFHYDDEHGKGKAKDLADAVHEREKDSSDVGTRMIGGTEFYYLSFPSPNDETLLRYEFYGQTEPDQDFNYMFYVIVLDQLKGAAQFDTLQDVLDCVDFSSDA